MTIPYLKNMQGRRGEENKGMSKAEFAQAGRDALQRYLVELIRSVVSALPPCFLVFSARLPSSCIADLSIRCLLAELALTCRSSDPNPTVSVNSSKSPPSPSP